MAADGAAPPALPRNIACAISMLAQRLQARERPAVLLWTRFPDDKAVAFEQRGSVLVATLLRWGSHGSNYLFDTKNAVALRLRVKPDGGGIQERDFKRLCRLTVEFLDETEEHLGSVVVGLFNAERLEGVLSCRLVRAWHVHLRHRPLCSAAILPQHCQHC